MCDALKMRTDGRASSGELNSWNRMFDEDSSSFTSLEDHHGQVDGAALVADVAIAVLPSQFHLAICQTAPYSATHPPPSPSHFPLESWIYEGQLVAVPGHTQLELLLLLQVNGG